MLGRVQDERAAAAGPGPGSERDARASDGARAPRNGPRPPGADDAGANGAAAPEARGNGAAAQEDDLADSADSGNGGVRSGRNGDAESRGGGGDPSPRGPAGGGGASEEHLVLAGHLVDFWTNICVCHSLIVERSPDGEVNYQVQRISGDTSA